MTKMIINGKEITTNYRQEYRLVKGNDRRGYSMAFREWVLDDGCKYRRMESEREMLERLVDRGYTTIQFAETTTSVRGLHDLFAYVK